MDIYFTYCNKNSNVKIKGGKEKGEEQQGPNINTKKAEDKAKGGKERQGRNINTKKTEEKAKGGKEQQGRNNLKAKAAATRRAY